MRPAKIKNSLCFRAIWPQGYKTFFMLNSAEHEIFHSSTSQITNNAKFFLAKHNWAWNFPANKYENANYCWHFHIYKQRKFHAQLSWAWKKLYNLGIRSEFLHGSFWIANDNVYSCGQQRFLMWYAVWFESSLGSHVGKDVFKLKLKFQFKCTCMI